MNPHHDALDAREQRELERLEALAADGPMEDLQRTRLDALRARCAEPERWAEVHRHLASAYRELHHAAQAARTEELQSPAGIEFVHNLESRIRGVSTAIPTTAAFDRSDTPFSTRAPALDRKSARHRRLWIAAIVLVAAGSGAWWLATPSQSKLQSPSQRNGVPVAAEPEEHSVAVESTPPPVTGDGGVDPDRKSAARQVVRTALSEVEAAAAKDSFLAALDARFEPLRNEGWPVDVMVTRQIDRALNAATIDTEGLRELEGALRWMALRHPEAALPVLDRAARDPRVQSAALKALAEAGTPRALDRLTQRVRRDTETTPEAAQALASAGVAGVHRLLELWRGEKQTSEGVRTALYSDAGTLDRALAERIARERTLDRHVQEIIVSHGGRLTRQAILDRRFTHEFGSVEIELCVALGGEELFQALLDQAIVEFGSKRQELSLAIQRRLAFPAGVAEARASALRFVEEDDPRATILLTAVTRSQPAVVARVALALLDVPTLTGVYRDHVLLALAALPPGASQDLDRALEQRLQASGLQAYANAAAWAVALAAQINFERALRFLAARAGLERIDGALRVRIEKALHATLRAEPGLGALSALQRVQSLIQALL
jgi:hypothetical protein